MTSSLRRHPSLPVHARNPDEHHRSATMLELFFDLVSVIAISAATAGLHHALSEGHGLDVLPRFVFLFLTIWWAWMNFTWLASAFDSNDWLYRRQVMVIMGGQLLFAGGAGSILDSLNFSFGVLGWIIMRLGMVSLWLRVAIAGSVYRGTATRYATGICVAQVCWVIGFLATEPNSPLFFALGTACFLIELSVPLIAERKVPAPFHRHHIIERYGLLTIITFGELVLSIAHGFSFLYGGDPNLNAALVSTTSLILVFSLWEVYFCEPEPLPHRAYGTTFIWAYGHVFLFGATAAIGAAIAASIDVTAHQADVEHGSISGFLGAALAVWTLSLWFVRDHALRLSRRRAIALPFMSAVFLSAGILEEPVWVFAILAIVTSLWRRPRRNRLGPDSNASA